MQSENPIRFVGVLLRENEIRGSGHLGAASHVRTACFIGSEILRNLRKVRFHQGSVLENIFDVS